MKVVVVDDHTIFLESISLLLETIEGITVVGTFANPTELLANIESMAADILICDYYMPQLNGIELAFKLRQVAPSLKVLMLTSNDTAEAVEQSLQAGVKGFMPKNITKKELTAALHSIDSGATYFPESVIKILTQQKPALSENHLLTDRELEVLKLIASNLTGQQIAQQLNVSYHTVETHRKNIFKKLGVNSSFALIRYAIDKGLV